MIIDFHTHPLEPCADIRFPVHSQKELSRTIHFKDRTAQLVKHMDKSGVDVSVVLPILAPNEQVAEVVAKHAERLVGFAYGWPGENSRETLRYAVEELGLQGVKLFPAAHHLALSSIEIQEIIAEARTLHIPVLFDVAPPFMFHWQPASYARFQCSPDTVSRKSWEAHSVFRMLDSIDNQYSGNTLIAAHLGGGLPLYFLWKGVKEKYTPVIKNLNIYFDISSPYWITPPLIRIAVEVLGADRLLFGSDSEFFFLQKKAIENVKAAHLTEKQEAHLLCENARHILGL